MDVRGERVLKQSNENINRSKQLLQETMVEQLTARVVEFTFTVFVFLFFCLFVFFFGFAARRLTYSGFTEALYVTHTCSTRFRRWR